jgi:hypothetical protein
LKYSKYSGASQEKTRLGSAKAYTNAFSSALLYHSAQRILLLTYLWKGCISAEEYTFLP